MQHSVTAFHANQMTFSIKIHKTKSCYLVKDKKSMYCSLTKEQPMFRHIRNTNKRWDEFTYVIMKQGRSSNTSSSSNGTSWSGDWFEKYKTIVVWRWHDPSITFLLLPASGFCLHRHDDKYNSNETLNVIIFCSLQTRVNTIDKHYWRLSRTHLLKKT